MLDPFKSARDHLAVAREFLRSDARARELAWRILAVERQLDPMHPDWCGDSAAADSELRAVLGQLETLKAPQHATATGVDPLKQSSDLVPPSGVSDAISQLAKALGSLPRLGKV